MVSTGFLIAGAIFIMLAGLGLYRMPTLFTRMQAASKASTLGSIFILIGTSIALPEFRVIIKAVIAILFLLLTTPIAAHAMAEAAKTEKYDK